MVLLLCTCVCVGVSVHVADGVVVVCVVDAVDGGTAV